MLHVHVLCAEQYIFVDLSYPKGNNHAHTHTRESGSSRPRHNEDAKCLFIVLPAPSLPSITNESTILTIVYRTTKEEEN